MEMHARDDFVTFSQHENIQSDTVMWLATNLTAYSRFGTSREAYKELIKIKKHQLIV